VAPRSADLGVMLPYSPLHHLLLADAGASLVMTSGNRSDEPIAFDDDDAFQRLGGIADSFVVHDRPIRTRIDDSVVRALSPAVARGPVLIRRSRGYAPSSLELPVPAAAPVLACGAELKNTFCVAKRERAWVGHHIGDLRNFETLRSFADGVEHFERLFAVDPAVVAHDLHPDYLSTRYANEREGVEPVGVQHHHAHLAACLAEHGETGDAIGAIYDGSGLGPDATVWGGEILAGGLRGFERAGLLFPVRLPGGDAAAREPWRMACAWLAAALDEREPERPAPLRELVAEDEWRTACRMVVTGLNSPLTTSAGRLFDAVAAICGVRGTVSYEGQAAAELEGLSSLTERGAYPMPLIDAGADGEPGATIVDARDTVRALTADLAAGAEVPVAGARFHNALAAATAAACAVEAERRGLATVVLSGGVFQNRLLLERTITSLRDRGLEVLIPARLPPNDGGIAYGQAAIAAARP
jgi:hydrogenase maturation protein HypF